MADESLRYEATLARIEVNRGNFQETEAVDLTWEVNVGRPLPGISIAIGHLNNTTAQGAGQALVHASIVSRDGKTPVPDLENLQEYVLASGCAEAMYDAARRSLDVQASLMDISMNLPIKAPDITVGAILLTLNSDDEVADESPESATEQNISY